MLIPDSYEDSERTSSRWGVFGTTLLTFFLLEMGDKTQIATIALAARFDELLGVVLGTTFGMMVANVPAVYLGEIAATKINLKVARAISALVFVLLGLWLLIGPNI